MMKKYLRLSSTAAVLIATFAAACQVPVFRYALERWPADRYELVVMHEAPLTVKQTVAIERLQKLASRSQESSNCAVKVIQADQLKSSVLRAAWNERRQDGGPVIAALYPANAQEIPDRLIQTLALTDGSLNHLFDSPVRQEIAKRLSSGESAVWIFVPCGDPKQDTVASGILKTEIMANEKSLELPEQDEVENEDGLLEQVDIELKLDFSMVTLDRNDPKEQFLLKMLLASESDLEELNQPMAFPVLGRGRVLYALVGKGISAGTIGEACRFIIGPCSCQVKNQNPGFDLLMSCDWDRRIGKNKLSDPLPEANTAPVLLTIPPGRKNP